MPRERVANKDAFLVGIEALNRHGNNDTVLLALLVRFVRHPSVLRNTP